MDKKKNNLYKRVLMIDGFVDTSHKIFDERIVVNYEYINNVWQGEQVPSRKNPHGTAIAGIIAQNVPKEIEIINFDIFDADCTKQYNKLISALNHISENYGACVINMSLGIRNSSEELYELCKRMYSKGFYIVSAFDNAGAISYPAAYDFVIGVDVSQKVKKKMEYVWVENSLINIRGMGGLQRVAWENGGYTINQGSSFAAPHITALIQRCLIDGEENVMDYVRQHAVYRYDFEEKYNENVNININRAAIFPYNKEMHALVNYPELLGFELVAVYDSKYCNNIGKKVGKNRGYIVEDVDDCLWVGFDTMIIGHLSELQSMLKSNLKIEILEKCLKYNINVYMYDDYNMDNEIIKRFKEKNLSIFCSKTHYKEIHNKFGKLFSVSAPILGVFGTSKKQGKYTIQLMLRKKLQDKGYKVGQLSTEPNGKLFGINYIYPIGYNGIINRNFYEIIEDVNCLLHKIDEDKPDLILIGSQSGTTPMAYNNIAQIPMQQCAFLVGGNPDAMILNVNFDDKLDYIKRTVNLLEGLGRGKVIGIVVFPFAYENGWGVIRDKKSQVKDLNKLEKCRSDVEKYTKIRTYILGQENDEDMLANNCLSFFSGSESWRV